MEAANERNLLCLFWRLSVRKGTTTPYGAAAHACATRRNSSLERASRFNTPCDHHGNVQNGCEVLEMHALAIGQVDGHSHLCRGKVRPRTSLGRALSMYPRARRPHSVPRRTRPYGSVYRIMIRHLVKLRHPWRAIDGARLGLYSRMIQLAVILDQAELPGLVQEVVDARASSCRRAPS